MAISATQNALANGEVVAVKGIGGFHLACDAKNNSSLETLRKRKGRIDKPFAVMCRDLKTAENFVEINQAEKAILTSKERPILLLKKKANNLSELIAPNNQFLGVMLPYSPLHYFEMVKKKWSKNCLCFLHFYSSIPSHIPSGFYSPSLNVT